jgi:hypothetical protein
MKSEEEIVVGADYLEYSSGKRFLCYGLGNHSETGERLVCLFWADDRSLVIMPVEKFLGQTTSPNDPNITFPRFTWVPERD